MSRAVAVEIDPAIGVNMHESSDGSASRDYFRDRLRRDHPELYARYERGDMSLYRASVEAGIRARMRSVSIESPATAMRALCRVFDPAELRLALDAIEVERAEAVAQALRAIDEAREVMNRDPEAEP